MEHPPAASDLCAVIEVADSSLSLDLGPKLRAYASAGIPQYVVADLVNGRVLIHEEPAGDSYARVISLARGEAAQVCAGGGHVSIPVDRFLP
jgi:hypothetical protein